MSDKELWVHNNTNADVSLSDLGIKVAAGSTINVFKYNPYLTVEQVEKSKSSGSLAKRLESKILKIVTKKVSINPHNLHKLKEDASSIYAKKTNSSVIIEPKIIETTEDGGLDFADYGIDMSVSQVADRGAVFMKQKEDVVVEQSTETEAKPLTNGTLVSPVPTIVMEAQAKASSNPMGKVAKPATDSSKPFIVYGPPDSIEEVPAVSPEAKIVKDKDIIVVDGKLASSRSIKAIASGDPADAIDVKAGAQVRSVDSESFDAQVASKSTEGVIVMKMKETTASEEIKPKKTSKKK